MKQSHSYNSDLNFSFSEKAINLCIVGAGRAGEFHVNSLMICKSF